MFFKKKKPEMRQESEEERKIRIAASRATDAIVAVYYDSGIRRSELSKVLEKVRWGFEILNNDELVSIKGRYLRYDEEFGRGRVFDPAEFHKRDTAAYNAAKAAKEQFPEGIDKDEAERIAESFSEWLKRDIK